MTVLDEAGSGTPPTSSDDDDRRNRKLSEVARKLVVPEGITGSYWPKVRDGSYLRLGLSLDRWQDGIAGLLLAHRSDGVLAHTIGGFGMSLPRQVGKTHTIVSVMFGLCVEYPGLLAIWTSHHVKTNSETFQAVQSYCKREKIKPFIKKVYLGSGDEAVEFANGSRILFGARERGFGRGIPGVDVLMSDEAQILTQRAMQDMLATLNTSRLGLHIYVGTPPKPTDNSEMFTTMRREAGEGEATDIAWIEAGADEDADIDDVEQWMKANASCPHRTPVVSIQRLRRRLDDDGFRREALGIWYASENSSFDIAAWSELADIGADTPERAALVVDMSPDRRYCWIGVAGEVGTEKGDRVLLMATETTAATAVAKVQKLIEKRDIVEVGITGGAARALEPALVEAGIEYQRLSPADIAASYSTLQEAIKNGTVCHADQVELTTALLMTKTRFITSGESEVFDRRKYSANLSPAVACACALYRWGLNAVPMPVLL
jgi:phage terminase large subunit-like protein